MNRNPTYGIKISGFSLGFATDDQSIRLTVFDKHACGQTVCTSLLMKDEPWNDLKLNDKGEQWKSDIDLYFVFNRIILKD